MRHGGVEAYRQAMWGSLACIEFVVHGIHRDPNRRLVLVGIESAVHGIHHDPTRRLVLVGNLVDKTNTRTKTNKKVFRHVASVNTPSSWDAGAYSAHIHKLGERKKKKNHGQQEAECRKRVSVCQERWKVKR